MTVYLVGAGPGDPGLLTVRGAEVLSTADIVVHDRLADASLLDLAPARARRIDVGMRPDRHQRDSHQRKRDQHFEDREAGLAVVSWWRRHGGQPRSFRSAS